MTTTVTIRLPVELVRRLDQCSGGNRSAFLRKLAEAAVEQERPRQFTCLRHAGSASLPPDASTSKAWLKRQMERQ